MKTVSMRIVMLKPDSDQTTALETARSLMERSAAPSGIGRRLRRLWCYSFGHAPIYDAEVCVRRAGQTVDCCPVVACNRCGQVLNLRGDAKWPSECPGQPIVSDTIAG